MEGLCYFQLANTKRKKGKNAYADYKIGVVEKLAAVNPLVATSSPHLDYRELRYDTKLPIGTMPKHKFVVSNNTNNHITIQTRKFDIDNKTLNRTSIAPGSSWTKDINDWMLNSNKEKYQGNYPAVFVGYGVDDEQDLCELYLDWSASSKLDGRAKAYVRKFLSSNVCELTNEVIGNKVLWSFNYNHANKFNPLNPNKTYHTLIEETSLDRPNVVFTVKNNTEKSVLIMNRLTDKDNRRRVVGVLQNKDDEWIAEQIQLGDIANGKPSYYPAIFVGTDLEATDKVCELYLDGRSIKNQEYPEIGFTFAALARADYSAQCQLHYEGDDDNNTARWTIIYNGFE
jgi:hypothetical protein